MPEDEIVIITMDDMALVFEVTDAFGIHRESVSVELAREDPGGVDVDGRGMVEIARNWKPVVTSTTRHVSLPRRMATATTKRTTGWADSALTPTALLGRPLRNVVIARSDSDAAIPFR